MATNNTYRILVWAVVILLATNLSMGLSFWYHKQQDKKTIEAKKEQVEMPTEQRTRFFREQLNLRQDQMDTFRALSRNYNQSARRVTNQLETLRLKMVEIMGEPTPNEEELNTITENIGRLHTELKEFTINYYLSMKAECDADQQKKLNKIFMSMSKSKEDISLPQRGGRHRGWQAKE